MIEAQQFIGVRMVSGADRIPVVINVKEIVIMIPVKNDEMIDITLTSLINGVNTTLRIAEDYRSLLFRIFGEGYTSLLPPQQ